MNSMTPCNMERVCQSEDWAPTNERDKTVEKKGKGKKEEGNNDEN